MRIRPSDVHLVFATSPITTAIPAIIKAKLSGGKVCIWLQDLWPDSVAAIGAAEKNSLLYRVLGVIVRWIYSHTDMIMVQSPGFLKNLKQFGFSGMVAEVPNWAPPIKQQEGEIPTWIPRFAQDDFVVTFAGNLGKAQAISTILEVAKALRDEPRVKFLLVGDGSDKASSEAFVRKHGLQNVVLCGRRPQEDMPVLFSLSSALLVSLSRQPIFAQTIPSKVQAYMSAGRPILGSLDGVGAEIVMKSGSGLVSPSEDFQALAENIRALQMMPIEERLRLGQNAISYFQQHYQMAVVIGKIEQCLEELVSS